MRTTRRTTWAVLAMAVVFGAGYGASSLTNAAEKERHPAIHSGLRNLREAKTALEKGDNDFKGHRVAAIKAINLAIDECELCLKVD